MGDMSVTFSANQGGRSQRPPVIFLMGPTASGKTDLAVSLMERMDCELISVDSALIYRGMDIGTAKPDPAMLEKAPHALIDILDPWESYSVADFYSDALTEIQRIHSNGKIPILVGGTMMYFRVLRDGIAALPSADDAVRERINADALAHGWPYIHEQLRQVDPDSAARIKPNDAQRLQRALEVFRVSGKTMTEFWAQQSDRTSREIAHSEATHDQMETGKAENSDYTKLSESPALEAPTDLPLDVGLSGLPFPIVSLAIAPAERSVLHDRIERRYLSMLDQGFVDEVRGLKANSKIERAMPSMRCVGYRQVWDFLEGDVDFETSKFKGIVATRQLAKRQLTWLRSWSGLHWLDTFDKNVLDKALNIIKKDA